MKPTLNEKVDTNPSDDEVKGTDPSLKRLHHILILMAVGLMVVLGLNLMCVLDKKEQNQVLQEEKKRAQERHDRYFKSPLNVDPTDGERF